MSTSFTIIDDKHLPLVRIIWISDVPHFCGSEECTVEGRYEIRIDGDESLFGTRKERDETLDKMRDWFEQDG